MNLDRYRLWFDKFCAGYLNDEPEHEANYILKAEHTHRVCGNLDRILSMEEILPELRDIAWLAGLFHDLGRFPQYKRFRTFKDSISVNHGILSVEVLQEDSIVNDLTQRQLNILLNAVRYHNAYQVPKELSDPEELLCLKAVRDADKIDIWKIFNDYYCTDRDDRPSALGLGLPDVPTYSTKVTDQILNKNMVKLSDVQSLNDFKLLQLSWVFDLNFSESYRLFLERGYIEQAESSLPETKEIRDVLSFIRMYVNERYAQTVN